MKLIKKGAEANLYLHKWYGLQVVVKKRIKKKYRHKKLDHQIRNYRTVQEARMMHEARIAGVPTPIIYNIDKKSFTIIIEYIEGKRIKELLDNVSQRHRKNICHNIGMYIAKLHIKNIIHGDLTTSNFIRNNLNNIFIIDFGLSYFSLEVEDKGVDLHLLKRALNSTHFRFSEECFNEVVLGYKKVIGITHFKEILEKVNEIEHRGRYSHRSSVKGKDMS